MTEDRCMSENRYLRIGTCREQVRRGEGQTVICGLQVCGEEIFKKN